MTIFSDTRSVPIAEATRGAVLAGALLGLAVTATLSSSTRSESTSGQLAMAAGRVSTAAPESAAIKIAPAPIVDSRAEVFIGTGDGSNGFWSRP
jgi:hypothetical protein